LDLISFKQYLALLSRPPAFPSMLLLSLTLSIVVVTNDHKLSDLKQIDLIILETRNPEEVLLYLKQGDGWAVFLLEDLLGNLLPDLSQIL
jgi:hypothetical protein